MTVRHEIKSHLAKLLATEDLIVEHKKVQTAQFNVHTRVLILPNWDRASNNVYDMLVGHEVGHALYTPDRDWFKEIQLPPQFVNIVEDVRIEKLMKRRYPGLAKTFYTGYNELHDQDFFQVNDEDISNFNLADRANLHFKVGSFLSVPISTSEKPIIDLINDCETFDETLSAAEALYNFCKQEHKRNHGGETSKEGQQITFENFEDSGDNNLDIPVDNNSTVSDSDGGSSMEGGSDTTPSDDRMDDFDPTVETAEALSEALKELSDQSESRESYYIELPDLNLDNIIIPNTKIHDGINKCFISQQRDWDEANISKFNLFEESDESYYEFRKSAQKEVNYLVKEFECKKSADSYARATVSKTGVLDCSNLHTYKHNEDLFKKITTLADGKNHGLVFILDWSGSMSLVMQDTIKQLYNLLWFCRKVNIPFEVYAFTNCYPMSDDGSIRRSSYEKKAGLAFVEETFSLMNLFSSKVKTKVLEEQMKNIYRISCAFTHQFYCPFNVPIGLNLSGTPLNETLIALHKILPKFRKENNIQKVQCVILTDGEAHPLKFSKDFQRNYKHEPFLGTNYIGSHCVIRDRKIGRTYSCAHLGNWADVTDILIHNLRDNFPDMNFIGIRVLASRDAGQFIRRYTGYVEDKYDKIMSRWKKEKSFAIKNSGYHTYFGLSANALANDDEFEVEEDATKAQIKRAFVKSLRSKKMNKKILGEFIELVV